MSKRDDMSSQEEPSTLGQRDTAEQLPEEADYDAAANDGYEVSKPWPNAYRDEEWEEGPPRVRPLGEETEPEPYRRCNLKGSSPDEIAKAYTEMFAELTCEGHASAMDYFATARGIDDRVAARARKLAVACKLATLTMQLIAAADRHRKEMEGG